ncbi:MAG: DUF4837 family protein, partial [Candidatus Cloacimonetes bacterium]|nr:DUF4837 family protein [Candidatus Cloacimonadota bacterium]
TENLKLFLYENGDLYFNIFRDRLIARINHQSRRLDGYKLAFFEKLPFTMYIPKTYKLFENNPANRFVSFLWRSHSDPEDTPDKYISIYWEKNETNPVNQEWLLEKRKEIAWQFYDEDEFSADYTARQDIEFNHYKAYQISGKWQNQKHYVGGAFRSFAFYDEKLQTAYLIDLVIYFPRGFKLRYLLELEEHAKTFRAKEIG